MTVRTIAALALPLLATPTVSAKRTYLKGIVTDSITGEKLTKINVSHSLSGKGVVTDDRGEFRIGVKNADGKLKITALGYNPKIIEVTPTDTLYTVMLTPAATELDEIVIKPGKQKYSKHNNPAVELMRRLRAGAASGDPTKEKDYSYDKYEKIVLGLNEFNVKNDTTKKSRRSLRFIHNYTDTAEWSGKRVLNLIMKEKASTRLTGNYGKKDVEVVRGLRREGIKDIVNEENMMTILEDVFREIDIYEPSITLLQNRFVSPLSPISADFYKFYLTDTVTVGGKRCVGLQFAPHNAESMGFNGDIYVCVEDSMPYVKRVSMRLPSASNLNYVENIYVNQNYNRDSLGNREKTHDEISVEFRIMPGTPRMYAHRVTSYDNFSYRKREDLREYYDAAGNPLVIDGAENRGEGFWNANRMIPLSRVEARLGNLMKDARGVPFLMWTERILMFLESGYVKTGKRSYFDYGPLNTTVSYNAVEGIRLRAGGMTTANLSPHLFARGYAAYGCKDGKWKYSAELEYSFEKKKYHSREFPRHGFLAAYSYDLDHIGQHYLFTNPDNVFLSLKRKKSELVTYRHLGEISYLLETPSNFSLKASMRYERQEATPWVPFTFSNGTSISHYSESCFSVTLRYAPGEKFIQGRNNRSPVNMDAWIFQLTHEYGPKGMFGSAYEVNRTELSIQKRLWFSAFGYTDILLKGGINWSTVYYPSLLWPNANLSYTIQPESYSLMNPMEFANDKYVSLDMTYYGNGILFNRIPLLNKLKLREVVTFKYLSGGLSDKNDPRKNGALPEFPKEAEARVMSGTPYMEIGCGIDNILTFLRVDYVWRLTYRDIPGIDKSGVRVSLHFSF